MKRKKKKKKEAVTFIVIPGKTAEPMNCRVNRNLIIYSFILVLVFLISFVGIGYAYYTNQNEIKRINELKEDIKIKGETIKELNQNIDYVIKQQEEVSEKQNEVKKLMGINDSIKTESELANGGKGGEDKEIDEKNRGVVEKIQKAKEELSLQEKELDGLIARVKSEKDYFRAVPNQWPLEGRITSNYGMRTSPFGGNKKTFHDGIDIANNVGTQVVAAAKGEVIFAGWNSIYGKMVIIEHGYGFKSKYGHNSALLVAKGDTVEKGQVIARVGNTGRSTGPHLHFGIYKFDKTQDPMIYLP